MKIPAFWSKATAEESNDDGTKSSLTCWRWSDSSQDDARQSALAAAKQLLQRMIRGDVLDRYPYAVLPLREEIIQERANDQGEQVIAVTQNAYGSLVLNTAQVMFMDLDFPTVTAGDQSRRFFSRLLGKKLPPQDVQQEADAKARLERVLQDDPRFGLRVYRTYAGLRVLVTHSLFDPSADSTRLLLESVDTDPLYVRLSQSQKCFRARLTPKPWRCGHTANTIRWPRDSDRDRQCFDKWQSEYTERQSRFATCRFLETMGNETIHSEIAEVVELHDHFTRCHEALALA